MHFILDECVPIFALNKLHEMNLSAAIIYDYIAPQSPDQLVAAVVNEEQAVLISHDRDFKSLISRRPNQQEVRYRNAHMLKMDCKQPRIPDRLEMCMPIITAEYEARQEMRDPRMIIYIGTDALKVWR